MYTCAVRPEIAALSAYVPGMSIAEIQEKYGLSKVVKMASNENPLGVSPLVREALGLHAGTAFRYPQGGNPRLVAALARTHGVSPDQVVVGNGSDEIIDMLIRMLLVPGKHSVVCFEPCFSIYPIQAQVCGVEVRRHPLNADFSFDLDALFALVDDDTRLVFVTTPDNPSGYCPPLADVRRLAQRLGERFPHCLLVVDEAYMDFAGDSPEDEARFSLLASGDIPDMTTSQIDQLRWLVDREDLPVLCFGLRTDFRTQLFPGSRRLFELADSITEIKTICDCGRKATTNARISPDGYVITEGDQVFLGGNDSYIAMCHKCYQDYINEHRKVELLHGTERDSQ